jgi:hypothetical protein
MFDDDDGRNAHPSNKVCGGFVRIKAKTGGLFAINAGNSQD